MLQVRSGRGWVVSSLTTLVLLLGLVAWRVASTPSPFPKLAAFPVERVFLSTEEAELPGLAIRLTDGDGSVYIDRSFFANESGCIPAGARNFSFPAAPFVFVLADEIEKSCGIKLDGSQVEAVPLALTHVLSPDEVVPLYIDGVDVGSGLRVNDDWYAPLRILSVATGVAAQWDPLRGTFMLGGETNRGVVYKREVFISLLPGLSPSVRLEWSVSARGLEISSGSPPVVPVPPKVVHHGLREKPRVALTFDDALNAQTEKLLEMLRAYRARATFFTTGESVLAQPQTATRIVAEGSELGSHTWNHTSYALRTIPEFKADLLATRAAIYRVTGEIITVFRPVGGRLDEEGLRAVAATGHQAVFWDILVDDTAADASAPDICLQVVEGARSGSIVLMHNGSEPTLEALPCILAGLRNRGFQFVTVSEIGR